MTDSGQHSGQRSDPRDGQRAGRDDGRRLCAVLGHELRNPLASVVTNVTVAAEMTDPDDKRSAFLCRALSDLERLSRLLTAYLEHGRSAEPRRSRLDLADVIAKVAARYPPERLARAFADGPLELDADPDLLGRAVENVIENSFEAGAGRVDLRLRREGPAAAIYVSDDGPGVAGPVRATLFEPFVSGRGSTGLGLALTRDIVEAHGGRVELLPSARGARFRVTVPLAVRQSEPLAEQGDAYDGTPWTGKPQRNGGLRRQACTS